MKSFKRLVFGVVTLAVAGYLLPLAQFQLFHDLVEISIHRDAPSERASIRELAAPRRSHDCHSCLASHPGASVLTAPRDAGFAGPQLDRRLPAAERGSLAFRKVESPNKRSPPA